MRRKSAKSKLKDGQTGDNQLNTGKFDRRPQLGQCNPEEWKRRQAKLGNAATPRREKTKQKRAVQQLGLMVQIGCGRERWILREGQEGT